MHIFTTQFVSIYASDICCMLNKYTSLIFIRDIRNLIVGEYITCREYYVMLPCNITLASNITLWRHFGKRILRAG